MRLAQLRQQYHSQICSEIIRITKDKTKEYPNFADGTNRGSVSIAWSIIEQFGCKVNYQSLKGQVVGNRFEEITRDFLANAFTAIQHLRPGNWLYTTEQTAISGFDQYEHLSYLNSVIGEDKSLASALGGDYIVKPDIVIGRYPISEDEINMSGEIVSLEDNVANLSPLRLSNQRNPRPILHASISCKWTIRSDRSQNTRTEALNLIRNRKG
ncbi:MAG TPA: NgoMIV family type II restriction endonuclease, partial [Anaerolineales bacterium]|nr:NgoMIV family type II restriction endonuclease [Anaerolineales bacterium]